MIGRCGAAALEAVLPWTCLACGRIQGGPGLCAACWSRMPWIAPPQCVRCGTPFDVGAGNAARGRICAACAGRPPVVAATRAALRYDAASRGLVLGFKHADRLHGAPVFADWLRRAGADLLPGAGLIAPVPLHWSRLAWRRYNQAAVLARHVAARSEVPCAVDLLVRRRRTPSQGDLSREGRRRNVAGAFAIGRRWRDRLSGRRIILVDDVITSGATLAACARVLLDGGAAAVDGLAIAQVVDPVGADLHPGSAAPTDLSSTLP
ncbi:MAG: ComF family protein [Alphaproteobacteria bacterium]|nr:ComF family protein [Alphaproteobacteria bacterium]